MMKEDALYQSYITEVYQQTSAYQSYSPSIQKDFTESNVCITYGELLYPSVKKIIHRLQLTAQDVFCDLGSGLGKCALQMFLQTDVKKVIGIEAASTLHQQAISCIERVKKDFPYFW